jgi:hypothetical protein
MDPREEHPHQPADDPWWGEWWRFDFDSGDPALGGVVRICLLPNQGRAWYWASLVGAGRRPVVVHDDEVPLPRLGTLELRSEGLWADHIIEVPFEQVTVACEAFGLRLDDPADMDHDPILGERIPFGLDLEWESEAGSPLDAIAPGGELARTDTGYAVVCEVHGDVLVADERIAIETAGHRSHGWGVVRGSSRLPIQSPR